MTATPVAELHSQLICTCRTISEAFAYIHAVALACNKLASGHLLRVVYHLLVSFGYRSSYFVFS